jgi:ATP phosphoribosyltransferase
MTLSNDKLLLAIPKGRILASLEQIFKNIEFKIEDSFYQDSTRKLIFKTNIKNIEVIKVRSFDVATFVKYGGADIGIAGLDVIEEFNSEEIYRLIDLNIGKCRLSIASSKDILDLQNINQIKVATKYVNLATRFFNQYGIQAQIIKLNGAIEIAAKIGLADYIIDLVDTGKTLKSNNMIENMKILKVSSYLITNKAAFVQKNKSINDFITNFLKIDIEN